jgi:hypothetical protein
MVVATVTIAAATTCVMCRSSRSERYKRIVISAPVMPAAVAFGCGFIAAA